LSRRNLSDSVNKYRGSEQFERILFCVCQNRIQNCSERKLELPARVTEMLPDTSDNTDSAASDATAASDDKEQLVVKTLSQCTNLLSLCHFIKHNHQNHPLGCRSKLSNFVKQSNPTVASSQILLLGCAAPQAR